MLCESHLYRCKVYMIPLEFDNNIVLLAFHPPWQKIINKNETARINELSRDDSQRNAGPLSGMLTLTNLGFLWDLSATSGASVKDINVTYT